MDLQPVMGADGGAVSEHRVPWATSAKYLLFVLGIAFLVTSVVLPVAYLFQTGFGGGLTSFWRNISSPEALFSLRFSLALALAATAINGVMGTVVAFMLVKNRSPFRGLLDALVDVPLIIPSAVTGLTVLLLYGPVGLLGELFDGAGITIMFAFPGILIAHVFLTIPFVVRAVRPILEQADGSEEEAAKILGANQVQIFTGIVLPAIKGGLISGCIFTFIRSLGEFGATILVSGNLALENKTAPLFVFSEFNEGNVGAASSMSVLLIVVSFILFFGCKLIFRFDEPRGIKIGKRTIAQESKQAIFKSHGPRRAPHRGGRGFPGGRRWRIHDNGRPQWVWKVNDLANDRGVGTTNPGRDIRWQPPSRRYAAALP